MKLPNGSKASPLMQLFQWIANPMEFMDNCSQRYGDCFTVRLWNFKPMVFLSNPQAIEEIFTLHQGQFNSGRANFVLELWVGDILQCCVCKNFLTVPKLFLYLNSPN